jgi:hypothetical protein
MSWRHGDLPHGEYQPTFSESTISSGHSQRCAFACPELVIYYQLAALYRADRS